MKAHNESKFHRENVQKKRTQENEDQRQRMVHIAGLNARGLTREVVQQQLQEQFSQFGTIKRIFHENMRVS